MNKKIIYVSNSVVPSFQANSVHVINMSKAFDKLGVLESIYVYKGKNFEALYNHYDIKKKIKIICYFLAPAPFLNLIEALFTLVRTKKKYFIFGRNVKICLFCALFGRNVLLEVHQPLKFLTISEKFLLFLAIKLKKIQNIVCISNALKKILEKELNNKEIKVYVLPDAGNETKKFRFNKIKNSKIGYTGSLIKGRGIEIIFKLAKELEKIEFHIAGGNEYIIGEMTRKKPKNLFFHGYLNQKNLEYFRLSMDVLIAPYQNDTSVLGGKITTDWMSPLKIFEYMSAKKPIIVSNIKVLNEILTHKKNCMMVKPNSITQWKNTINYVLKEKNLSYKLAQQAHKDFLNKFTWEQRAKRVVEILNFK